MFRIASFAVLSASIAVQAAMPIATASEHSSPDLTIGQSVPLDSSDLNDITLAVMNRYPLLSSSPGIRFAQAQRSVRSMDIATVIYFPHTESAGLKQAFQVRCERQASERPWVCNDVEIRRYLKLESQDFEVRITGEISTRAAMAAIQASRGLVKALAPKAGTVSQVLPDGDGSYLIDWGTADGQGTLTTRARLKEGADPSQAEGWVITLFESDTRLA